MQTVPGILQQFNKSGGIKAASEEEKLALVWAAREAPSPPGLRPLLENLAVDESEEVRKYALQTLVLDLNCKDAQAAQLCWNALEVDPELEVRSMGAACIGNIYFASRRTDLVRRLRGHFDRAAHFPALQWTLLDSMRLIAGQPPIRWNVSRQRLTREGPGADDLQIMEAALRQRPAT